MLKKYYVYIVIAAIVIAVIAIFATKTFDKSALNTLKATYAAQVKADAAIVAKLQTANTVYYSQLKSDSLVLIQKNAEIAKLQTQNVAINTQLVAVKNAIKNYTAGQAIKYFVDYSKTTDTKMIVQGTDTSMVVSYPSIKVVDTIFAEHYSFGLQITNLNKIVTDQNGVIINYKDQVTLFQSLIKNKDAQISTQDASCVSQKAILQLNADKYKSQRNKAYWLIGTPAVIAVAALAVKIFVLK